MNKELWEARMKRKRKEGKTRERGRKRKEEKGRKRKKKGKAVPDRRSEEERDEERLTDRTKVYIRSRDA